MNGHIVAVNERGFTIGEDHCRAVLTDAEVQLMRDMRAADPAHWTYQRLATKFEVSKKHAWRICNYVMRAQIVDSWQRRGMRPKADSVRAAAAQAATMQQVGAAMADAMSLMRTLSTGRDDPGNDQGANVS